MSLTHLEMKKVQVCRSIGPWYSVHRTIASVQLHLRMLRRCPLLLNMKQRVAREIGSLTDWEAAETIAESKDYPLSDRMTAHRQKDHQTK